MKAYRPALTCLLLLVVALWLRLPGLDSFLTPDETLWSTRSVQFITALQQRDWAATNITGHPGVTTMWAGSLGLAAKSVFDRPPEAQGLTELTRLLAADPIRLDFLPWLRLPVVLACSLAIAVVYLLARRLFRESTALLGAALLSLDPFLLAHSRVLQMDALLAVTITVAWLALLVALRTNQRRYYILSGIAYGLAVLTKSPALVAGPLMVGVVVLTRWQTMRSAPRGVAAASRDLLYLGVPAVTTIFVMWPALWTTPVDTLMRVLGLMMAYSQGGHELGNFWMGKPVTDPGHAFYLAALLWRTTPVTLLGLLLLPAACVVRPGWPITKVDSGETEERGSYNVGGERLSAWALLVFVLWYGTILSFGDKQFDRYLLTIFPAVDLLAAWSWAHAGCWLWARFAPQSFTTRWQSQRLRAPLIGAVILVVLQSWAPLVTRPSYLTAYNPIMGGIRTARDVMLVGWGEGLAEAAGYLNGQENAEKGHVATWYGQNVFRAFYRGHSYDLYYDTLTAEDLYAHDVDYVVTYINQEQRELLDDSVRERLDDLLYTSQFDGTPLAQVFRWPKPFGHTANQLLGKDLRLSGWSIDRYDVGTGRLAVTLYWNAAEMRTDVEQPQLVIWMKDAAGEVWARAEGSPDAGVRQRGWLDRMVTAQTLTMVAPVGILPGPYRIEMAVPGAQTFALGEVEIPPTTLAEVREPSMDQPEYPVFGTLVRLASYAADVQGPQLTLDLVWVLLDTPGAEHKFFVHLVDKQDAIVAQYDAPLVVPGATGQQASASLHPGDLARYRVRLAIPPETQDARIYIGVYRPGDGSRVPAVANGQLQQDGRYLLLELGNR